LNVFTNLQAIRFRNAVTLEKLQSSVELSIFQFSESLFICTFTILPFRRQAGSGIVMREKHNATKGNVATINLQVYSASTNASVVALVRSCGDHTELRKAANLWKTTVLSSVSLLKEYFNNRNEYN
jgi:hypothetical protein